METYELDELCRRKKSQCLLLTETADLTKQLAQALERRDQVSSQMLLNMREAPIQSLREISEGIENYILSLPEESAIRGHELLTGSEAEDDREIPLCEEVARFRRLLYIAIDLDRAISLKVGGKASIYTKL